MCTENSIVCGSKFIGQKVYLMSLNQPKQIVTPKKKKKSKRNRNSSSVKQLQVTTFYTCGSSVRTRSFIDPLKITWTPAD